MRIVARMDKASGRHNPMKAAGVRCSDTGACLILDLLTAASQPMVDPSSGDALVLNGEIYNYVELRRKLERLGHSFHSTGDTEVMLRARCVNGIAAIPELRGMFAFAFWQASSRSLLLARDPLGIKPLYIAQSGPDLATGPRRSRRNCGGFLLAACSAPLDSNRARWHPSRGTASWSRPTQRCEGSSRSGPASRSFSLPRARSASTSSTGAFPVPANGARLSELTPGNPGVMRPCPSGQ